MKKIFSKKSIEELITCSKENNNNLKRSIGPVGLILLGLGSIIGAGIFIVPGVTAANYSGPALLISFVISAIACAFTALCYAEFSSMIPVAGSVYTYTYVTLGEIWAWIIGWILIFEYLISASAIAVGWSSYTLGFLSSAGINFPAYLTSSVAIGGFINLPAVLIIGILTGILVLGAKESTRVNAVIVMVNIMIILLFIIVGLKFINYANYIPFTPFGISGVFQGAAMVFFAYIGFDAVSTAAEETKNPQKNLPIGIIGSLIISSILYIIVATVLTGVVPYNLLNNSAPVAFALKYVGMNWIASIVSVGALCGLTSVLLTSLFGQTRIFFAMSRDGLLPSIFSRINHNYSSPVTSILLVGIVAAFIAAFIPLSVIIELVNIGTLSAFIFLAISVIILRRQQPDIPRSFKCPLVPLIPIISIFLCIFLISQLSSTTHQRFIVSLIIGVIIYLTYGMRKSKLNNTKNDNLIEAKLIDDHSPIETKIEKPQ